jgi:hypothetical protein
MLSSSIIGNAFTWDYTVYDKIAETTIWVIIANINSPYNGKAEYTREFYFYWEFGSLVSKTEEFSITTKLSTTDGRNAYLAQFGRVAIYDVYYCDIFDCTYQGRIAEVEEWYNNIMAATFEDAGDKVDDTCLKLITVDGNGNELGWHLICPVYNSVDGTIEVCEGITEFQVAISESESYTFSFDMGISISGISLNGLVKGNFKKDSSDQVIYYFYPPQAECITWYIDYLGPQVSGKYPIEWAFYAVTGNSQSVNEKCALGRNRLNTTLSLNTESHIVDINGTLMSSFVSKYKEININSDKVITVNMVNVDENLVLKPILLKMASIKAVKWIIWVEKANGTRFSSDMWGEPDFIIDSNKLTSIVLTRASSDTFTKAVVEVTFNDGSKDFYFVILNGYTFKESSNAG